MIPIGIRRTVLTLAAGAALASWGCSSDTENGGGSSTGGGGAGATGGTAGAGATGGGQAGGGAGGGLAGGGSGGGVSTTCGDLDCEAGETCSSCEVDCGKCMEPVITECNDGIDNDGDGLTDWQLDVGCWGEGDNTEASGARSAEAGWTTFDLQSDSQIIYVSSSGGDDSNDGATPETAVATLAKGAELVRDGFPDFLLLKRGDTWRGEDIGPNRVARRFKSGRSKSEPLVVSSYGDSTERPRLEIDKAFIDDDGHERRFLAVVGLALVSYKKIPGDAEFNGADGGALRFVGTGGDLLFEDNYVEYGEYVVQNITDVEIRRNVIYRSYHVGTCAFNPDGSPNPNGDPMYRPSGIFAGSVDGLIIDDNVFDENGWNPDVPEACATIYNHDMYLSGNSRVRVRDNLILRASSIGIKMSSGGPGESTDIQIENNLFAEGEIGLSMGGNADTQYRFVDAIVRNNVFTDIGRSQPTKRTLSWYVGITDNDRTEIAGNLFANQPDLGNSHGINLNGDTNRDINIHDNYFYGMQRRDLLINMQSQFSKITIQDNQFVTDSTKECQVSHDGGFSNVTYTGNAYSSGASADSWFCVDGARQSLDQWKTNEPTATTATLSGPEPGRNLDSYASHLGLGSDLAAFASEARKQSRHTYRPELSATNANRYIRDGFGVPNP